MVRILHFSDLHLGTENYGQFDPETGLSSRMGDFIAALDRVVDYALATDVQLVLFAGDAYKTCDPSPTLQREFARRVKDLAGFLFHAHNAGRGTKAEGARHVRYIIRAVVQIECVTDIPEKWVTRAHQAL